jgi:hypothetical protein
MGTRVRTQWCVRQSGRDRVLIADPVAGARGGLSEGTISGGYLLDDRGGKLLAQVAGRIANNKQSGSSRIAAGQFSPCAFHPTPHGALAHAEWWILEYRISLRIPNISKTSAAMHTAIIDTEPLVAFFDRAERHHRWVTE